MRPLGLDRTKPRLVNLPAVLRLLVLGLVVGCTAIAFANRTPMEVDFQPDYRNPDLRIARVNRQLHEEAMSVVYSQAVFPFIGTTQLRPFFDE